MTAPNTQPRPQIDPTDGEKKRPVGEVIAAILLLISILLLLITATQAQNFKSVVLDFEKAADTTAQPRYSARSTVDPERLEARRE